MNYDEFVEKYIPVFKQLHNLENEVDFNLKKTKIGKGLISIGFNFKICEQMLKNNRKYR